MAVLPGCRQVPLAVMIKPGGAAARTELLLGRRGGGNGGYCRGQVLLKHVEGSVKRRLWRSGVGLPGSFRYGFSDGFGVNSSRGCSCGRSIIVAILWGLSFAHDFEECIPKVGCSHINRLCGSVGILNCSKQGGASFSERVEGGLISLVLR